MVAMQALNAAAIDTMLPALSLIGIDFGVIQSLWKSKSRTSADAGRL